ncbi:restriction endonuclease subunit S, partial [Staphylococcus pseudintermedius]|nr:restriction endonuclease subunit S [Staphylococcus pseudintermedius]
LTENAVRIRSFNESVLSTKFLSYFLKSDQGQNEMFIRTVGSTQPKLAITRIKDINIPIIDIKSQQKISNILSTIDEKITLNKNLIANLEELSQTLFKRWFVDFEFPDENGNPYKSSGGEMIDSEMGLIPRGWEVKSADEIYEITIGKTPPRKLTELFSEKEG